MSHLRSYTEIERERKRIREIKWVTERGRERGRETERETERERYRDREGEK